jgi:hypothetical protein
MSSRREIPGDEYLPMDLMVTKAKEGAVWFGSDQMNIGWPEELVIGGQNLIRLLEHQRDAHRREVEAADEALKQHHVTGDGLSLADRIHLLVGRKAR